MDDQQVAAVVKTDLSWLQKHERLLIVLMVLSSGVYLGNHWLDNSAAHDKAVSVAADQQLQQQKDANTKLASQAEAAASQLQKTISVLTVQNSQLAAAVAARDKALTQQQKVDSTLPLSDLGQRWQSFVPAVTVAPAVNGLTVNETGARQTVEMLEQVPVLEANVHDTQLENTNDQKELTQSATVISALNQQVGGLNAQLADKDKACTAELASVKADARKSKRNWLLSGLAAGASVAAFFLK